jgi:hypothetical protein
MESLLEGESEQKAGKAAEIADHAADLLQDVFEHFATRTPADTEPFRRAIKKLVEDVYLDVCKLQELDEETTRRVAKKLGIMGA